MKVVALLIQISTMAGIYYYLNALWYVLQSHLLRVMLAILLFAASKRALSRLWVLVAGGVIIV